MKKESLNQFNNKLLIHESDSSVIYKLADGRVLKIIKPLILELCNRYHLDYEAKINSKLADDIPEIVKPLSAVYIGDNCIGYTMEEVIGQTLGDYEKYAQLEEQCDIKRYVRLYSAIERIVRKGHSKGIIFSDICTAGNIIITPQKEIKIIDFDGLQLGSRDKTISISNSLGDPAKYIESKKFSKYRYHFTKEIDIASLTVLFYMMLFNLNINIVNLKDEYGKLSYDDFFEYINLYDQKLIQKTKVNFSEKGTGSFLEDDLYRIADQNILIPAEYIYGKNIYTKRLMRK